MTIADLKHTFQQAELEHIVASAFVKVAKGTMGTHHALSHGNNLLFPAKTKSGSWIVAGGRLDGSKIVALFQKPCETETSAMRFINGIASSQPSCWKTPHSKQTLGNTSIEKRTVKIPGIEAF